MILVERHVFKKKHKLYKELDNLCFLSKNLYNATMYEIRQYYFDNKKMLSYSDVNKLFIHNKNSDYYALNTKVSQQTQKLVDQMFKSFFGLLKKYKNDPAKKIHLPGYLDKNGRQVVMFTNQAVSTKTKGFVKLGGTNISIPTNVENVQFARVVPRGTSIVIEIGYNKPEKEYIDNGVCAGIDLGVDNLATLTFTDSSPIIFNGKPVKAINQYYNKKLAKLQSKQDTLGQKSKITNRMYRLIDKRNSKIKDYIHKCSREIVNQLVSHNVTNLVIGYNKQWKQDTNMGKKNNQKFVQVPFLTFVNMIKYKCELEGIRVETICESHTSKCSFLNKEAICHHDTYAGKRIHRGLFRTHEGKLINADVNGSLNILRRYLKVVRNTDIYKSVNLIEVCSTPTVFTVKS